MTNVWAGNELGLRQCWDSSLSLYSCLTLRILSGLAGEYFVLSTTVPTSDCSSLLGTHIYPWTFQWSGSKFLGQDAPEYDCDWRSVAAWYHLSYFIPRTCSCGEQQVRVSGRPVFSCICCSQLSPFSTCVGVE